MNQMLNLKQTNHLKNCPANVCPFDEDANFRRNLPGEKRCPYTINRKRIGEKGIKTLMPYDIVKFIPIRNVKLLNKRNQKLWQDQNVK